MSVRKGSVVIASFVDDSNVVHKAGTETITGNKTVDGSHLIMINDTVPIYLKNNNVEQLVAPSEYSEQIIMGHDKNGIRIGSFGVGMNTQGKSRAYIGASKYINGSYVYSLIDAYVDSNGNCTCNLPTDTYGTNFHGTADYAKYADLAEKYQSDQEYSVGTLIKFGGKKDITIADNKVNGVISHKPGVVLDSELEDGQPIALVGKTPIRVIGKVNKFDNITLSEIPGIGRVAKEGEVVIAKALEASENEEEKLVLCVTKFNLD